MHIHVLIITIVCQFYLTRNNTITSLVIQDNDFWKYPCLISNSMQIDLIRYTGLLRQLANIDSLNTGRRGNKTWYYPIKMRDGERSILSCNLSPHS